MPVTAVSRRTCLGSSFDRLLYRTRVLVPGDQIARLVEQVVLPDVRPGDIVLLSSRAVSACQGRMMPLSSIEPSRLARTLASLWRELSQDAPLAHPAAMHAALQHDGTLALSGSTAMLLWRSITGQVSTVLRTGSRGLLRVGQPTDLPVYHGQLILPPRQPQALARELWKNSGYRVAIVSVRQPGQVQVTALSPGLSPDFIRLLVLDNPLGKSDALTPIAILRKRR